MEFHSREGPRCYRKWLIRGFDRSDTVIWVRSWKRLKALLECDRTATWEKHQLRTCKLCGRMMMGFAAQAQDLREAEALAAGKPVGRCGSECKDASRCSRTAM